MSIPDSRNAKVSPDAVLASLRSQDPESLRCFYTEYSERMRHTGAQVWLTGSVFIPLSLAGVIVTFKTPGQTFAVAVFSILLIWIWYLISVVPRHTLDRDLAISVILEAAMLHLEGDLADHGVLATAKLLEEKKGMEKVVERILKDSPVPLWFVRLGIPMAITIGWLAGAIVSILQLAMACLLEVLAAGGIYHA